MRNPTRVLALAAALVALAGSARSLAAEATPDYATDVAPLLRKYCVGCHGGDTPESALSLESYAAILKGGSRGAAFIAGRADLSRMLLVVEGKAEPKMPPEGNEAPTPAELAVLTAWVTAGAKGPDGAEPDPTEILVPHLAPSVAPRLSISSLAWSPDGKLLAIGGPGRVRLIAPEDRSDVRTLDGLRGSVNGLAFSSDSARLFAASGEPGLLGLATIWQVADGAKLAELRGHRDTLYAVALSPDGKILATASYDQKIRLWDAATGGELRALDGHNGAVYDVAFSPDGRLLASASGDGTVKLWNVAEGTRLDTFGQPTKEQLAVAFSPDGRIVVGAGGDNRIRYWRLSETAAEGTNPLIETRFAHEGSIVDLVFSPDGRRLATGADDRTVKIWQAMPLVEEHLLADQPDWPSALAFSPDGKQLAIGRLDGSLALVQAESGEPVPVPKPELTAVEPRGVQRGVASPVQFVGKNLGQIERVEFDPPRLTAEPAGGATFRITAAPDAPRGPYKATVITAGGQSKPITLYVDDLPQLIEIESSEPAPLAALPASLWGVVGMQGDIDEMRFEAVAGQTLVFDLQAKSLGSKLDGVLTLIDAGGHVLATNNNFDGQDDPILTYTFTAPGTYAIRVRDLVLGGSAEHGYRLSVGALPLVTGVYPPSVPAGATTEVELVGYNLPADARVAVTAAAEPELPVPVDAERFRARRDLKVAVDPWPQSREVEPNDSAEAATPMTAPGVAVGRIGADSSAAESSAAGSSAAGAAPDADLFRFEAKAGQTWIIETDAARRGSPVDTKIEVLDAAGKPVPRLLLQAVRDSYVTFRGINSASNDVRLVNWEEMELNELLYLQGEVCKLFRLPQGPDSGFLLYASGGNRQCYFDTSPTTHAVDEPAYIVEARPLDAKLVPNGLPVFTLNYANDDDGRRQLGSDSQLTFTAPADGAYLIRVSDVRALGGDRFAYRLIVRSPAPDFNVSVGGTNPGVRAGSGRSIPISVDRIDGFDGEIRVDITGMPPGIHVSSPVVIQAGQLAATAVVWADPEGPEPTDEQTSASQITATATIAGTTVTKPVNNLGKVRREARGKLLARLEPAEVTIRPGTTITATLKVERHGFEGPINFDVQNLPHGVYVDNIGLNGVLIPEGQTERQIFLTARRWVPETTRMFHAVAVTAGNEVSPPITLHVRKPETVAAAPGEPAPPQPASQK